MSGSFAMTIAAIVIAFSDANAEAQSVARIEVQPIQTVTLNTAQILTGDMKGVPATLAGELRIPKPGSDRLPAVILIHGSGGVGGNVDTWPRRSIRSASPPSFWIHFPDVASSTRSATNHSSIRWR
jgi:acetyl esterase/lipase